MEAEQPLVVYTAIFGDFSDRLYAPQVVDPGIRYLAFVDTDEPHTHNGWQCVPPSFRHADPRRQARQHKLLPHLLFPGVRHSIWIDGCFTPCGDFRDLVRMYLSSNVHICTFKHCERNCVYQELEACLRLRKDRPGLMRRQIDRYRQEGYPHNNGLAETGVMLRAHTPEVKEFNELWWDELSRGSVRDQLSFNYSTWRLGMHYGTFRELRRQCQYFRWRAHR